jgi:putative acetyltransferase
VHHDLIGQGVGRVLVECWSSVGRVLYENVLAEAQALGISRLHSQVSDAAKSFFEGHGWIVVETQTIERRGVVLTNQRMERRIS